MEDDLILLNVLPLLGLTVSFFIFIFTYAITAENHKTELIKLQNREVEHLSFKNDFNYNIIMPRTMNVVVFFFSLSVISFLLTLLIPHKVRTFLGSFKRRSLLCSIIFLWFIGLLIYIIYYFRTLDDDIYISTNQLPNSLTSARLYKERYIYFPYIDMAFRWITAVCCSAVLFVTLFVK